MCIRDSPKSYVNELKLEAEKLRDQGFEGTSQELANMARSNVNANIESSGFEFDSGIEAGQYLDDKTKKVMGKFGYDTSSFGDNAMNKRARKQMEKYIQKYLMIIIFLMLLKIIITSFQLRKMIY